MAITFARGDTLMVITRVVSQDIRSKLSKALHLFVAKWQLWAAIVIFHHKYGLRWVA